MPVKSQEGVDSNSKIISTNSFPPQILNSNAASIHQQLVYDTTCQANGLFDGCTISHEYINNGPPLTNNNMVASPYYTAINSNNYMDDDDDDMLLNEDSEREGEFHCTEPGCPYITTGPFRMKTHMRYHQESKFNRGRKIYHCMEPHCGYISSCSSNYRVHKRTHSGVKPYHCGVDGCTFKSAQSNNLKTHVLRNHPGVNHQANLSIMRDDVTYTNNDDANDTKQDISSSRNLYERQYHSNGNTTRSMRTASFSSSSAAGNSGSSSDYLVRHHSTSANKSNGINKHNDGQGCSRGDNGGREVAGMLEEQAASTLLGLI